MDKGIWDGEGGTGGVRYQGQANSGSGIEEKGQADFGASVLMITTEVIVKRFVIDHIVHYR
jgi:hypothetical protein